MKRKLFYVVLLLWCAFSSWAHADLYFPHVDANAPWSTEICVINTGNDQAITGTLNAYDDTGVFVDSISVSLDPHARSQITVDDSFDNPGTIGYIVLDTDTQNVQGYTKFFQADKYRVAVPSVKDINMGDIYVSHIDSSDDWWTGLALVNTTDASVTLTITFNVTDGAEMVDPVQRTLAANAHEAFLIRDLFDGIAQPDIESAVITNGAGVIGLSLFGSSGSGSQLSGVLLKDSTANTIYYPHVASDATWWTGIVATNTVDAITSLDITPYDADGTALTPQVLPLDPMVKYVGTVDALNFPEGTAWLKIDADNPITGFELFGTRDGNQLAGYTGVGIMAQAGVFPRIEKDGWTGIAFVNAIETPATVSLTAYDDSGTAIAVKTMDLDAYEKVVNVIEQLFTEDISSATYIHYSCANEIVGFQLNGSADDMLLDGLPGLEAPLHLDDIDNDGDGVTEKQGDCDDNDSTVWRLLSLYEDSDLDGVGTGTGQNYCIGPVPYGFSYNGGDCDDTDETVWTLADGYIDTDNDNFGDPNTAAQLFCIGESLPTGYVDNGNDCDDNDPDVWQWLTGYLDADGDDYGAEDSIAQMFCTGRYLPSEYVDNNEDCDDTDANVNPDEIEVSGDGVDNNCNGEIDEAVVCTVTETYHWPHDNEVDSTMILYPPMWVEFHSTCGVNESTIQWIVEPRPLGTDVTDHVSLQFLGGTSYRLIWSPDDYEGLPWAQTNYEVTITFDDNEGNTYTISWDFWVGVSD